MRNTRFAALALLLLALVGAAAACSNPVAPSPAPDAPSFINHAPPPHAGPPNRAGASGIHGGGWAN